VHLDPAGISFALVALFVGSLATAVVNPRNRGHHDHDGPAPTWSLAVVVLVRYVAVVVLGVVVVAGLLDLPGRPTPQGSVVLGLVALLAAAVVVAHTTLVIQVLQRAGQV
jgi:hypothetical protein